MTGFRFIVGYLDAKHLSQLALCHLVAGIGALFTMFGNVMLATSPWLLLLVGWLAVCRVSASASSSGILRRATHTAAAAAIGVVLKGMCSYVAEDDGHIFKILRAKLGSFEDLMTGLYLCNNTYRAMTWQGVQSMAAAYLLQAAMVVGVLGVGWENATPVSAILSRCG